MKVGRAFGDGPQEGVSDSRSPTEVWRLLAEVDGEVERAFFLCGFHEGFRLPGEALGLSWGAVDFEARVLRPYDNWVRNELDTTKTANFAPVPMTTEAYDTLWKLYQRGYCTGDDDPVFTRDASGQRIAEKELRAIFKTAVKAAGLKVIPMYNARHSFGTGLARAGVDVRTIQALMRHERQDTTQMYMAYAPQEDLAQRMDAALSFARAATTPAAGSSDNVVAVFFERVDEEVPAKWACELRRLWEETGMLRAAPA